jgi:hypothetical protein
LISFQAMKMPTAFPLQLAPLPAVCSDDQRTYATPIPDGFVDDEVIASLIALPESYRTSSSPTDLILSSDENDFAGWSVPRPSPFRAIAERQALAVARMETTPEEAEPGIGQPHRGQHRWWIAAVAGVSTAMVLSLLFLNLGNQEAAKRELSSLAKPIELIQSALVALAP